MGKRAAEDQEWERHKEEIRRLYLTEKKTLSEVMTFMKGKGFTRS